LCLYRRDFGCLPEISVECRHAGRLVERSFAWIFDYRRLQIDYERLVNTIRAMIRVAFINVMLRKLWNTS
jgi:hypothetical protein